MNCTTSYVLRFSLAFPVGAVGAGILYKTFRGSSDVTTDDKQEELIAGDAECTDGEQCQLDPTGAEENPGSEGHPNGDQDLATSNYLTIENGILYAAAAVVGYYLIPNVKTKCTVLYDLSSQRLK